MNDPKQRWRSYESNTTWVRMSLCMCNTIWSRFGQFKWLCCATIHPWDFVWSWVLMEWMTSTENVRPVQLPDPQTVLIQDLHNSPVHFLGISWFLVVIYHHSKKFVVQTTRLYNQLSYLVDTSVPLYVRVGVRGDLLVAFLSVCNNVHTF